MISEPFVYVIIHNWEGMWYRRKTTREGVSESVSIEEKDY